MTKKRTYPLVLCAILGAAVLAGTLHAPREAVTAAAADSRTALYYRCPMHPTYTSDKPGTAPCCGMALEPVYARDASRPAADGSHASDAAVRVSSEQQQLIGVKVARFDPASGIARLRLYGRVVADETRIRKIAVGVNGYIRDAFEATTGSYVRKGQVLATFSTIEMRQPIGAYISALDVLDREVKSGKSTAAQTAAATLATEVTLDRLLTLGMSAEQVQEVKSTRAVPAQIHVVSPIDGLVVLRNVFPGQELQAATELFQIADLQRVWIVADVPAVEADLVKAGTAAEVAVGGRTIRARVSNKVPRQFDPATQSFTVRLEADNTGLALRPDMFVDVHLELPYEATLAIPREAIVTSGLRNSVFVERSAGVFEPREVKTGRRLGDRVEIVEGLAAGERLVVSGTFLLDSESRMRVR